MNCRIKFSGKIKSGRIFRAVLNVVFKQPSFDPLTPLTIPKMTSHLSNSKKQNRKDKIEIILTQAGKFGGNEQEEVQAWRRLCRELNHLAEPKARMPRFNSLLYACWIAAFNDQT